VLPAILIAHAAAVATLLVVAHAGAPAGFTVAAVAAASAALMGGYGAYALRGRSNGIRAG
jgi:hypothetical protein